MSLARVAPVLLVEPRESAATIIFELLQRLGFESIETVSDSDAALNLLTEKGPRLVIADMQVAPMSGLQFLRTIRSDERLKRTPFIIAAESLTAAEAVAIKNAGVDSFLLKPFRAEVLELKVAAAFKARPKARALPEQTMKKSLSAALGRRFERNRN